MDPIKTSEVQSESFGAFLHNTCKIHESKSFKKISYIYKYLKILIYLTKTIQSLPPLVICNSEFMAIGWEYFHHLTKHVEIGLSITRFKLSIQHSKLARRRKQQPFDVYRSTFISYSMHHELTYVREAWFHQVYSYILSIFTCDDDSAFNHIVNREYCVTSVIVCFVYYMKYLFCATTVKRSNWC